MEREVTMFGYPVRLTIDLPGGEHDITQALAIVTSTDVQPRTGFWIDTKWLLTEIEIEKRTRARLSA